MDFTTCVSRSLRDAQSALERLIDSPPTLEAIVGASTLMTATLARGGRLFSCGNGGSMCDAMHFAQELSGRYRLDRRPLAALAVSDSAQMSCVANDYGYEQIFARQLEALASRGDCLLAISTSGRSPNVIAAARRAQAIGATVVALTGHADSELGRLATIEIAVSAGSYADRVQELHIKIIHILIELVERQMFPENYPSE